MEIDLLQIKIEKAWEKLPAETRQAIDAVNWKMAILGMHQSKGYNFEQLGDLEIETELLLCGLLSVDNYPKELEKRMKIPKNQVDVLVNEMNELVFKKIREELIKNTEKNKENKISTPIPIKTETIKKNDVEILKQAGIEINETPHPILAQKLSSSFQVPITKTEYSLPSVSHTNTSTEKEEVFIPTKTLDPYRETPE